MPGVVLVEPLGVGGVADYTAQLASALAERGCSVEVVTATDHALKTTSVVGVHSLIVWERGGNRFGRFVRGARLGPLVNALRFIGAVPKIVRLARRRGVLHLQGTYFPPLYALLAATARIAGVPLVWTPHNLFMRAGPQFGWTRAFIGRCAAAMIVHVAEETALLPTWAAKKAVVNPLGISRSRPASTPPSERREARTAMGLGDSHLAVLLFGQLRPDKGIADLIAAAEQVQDISVVIAGREAGGLAEVKAAILSPALRGRVVIRQGHLAETEVASVFAAADVAVFPYRRASQSAAALLAYTFDTPIIVYPVGGLPELVEHGRTGWVTARSDVPALVETLREVADLGAAECARRGEAGGRLAAERYSWPPIAERTLAVYRDVAAGVPAKRAA